MKALVFVGEGFEDLEFFYPVYRLQEEGIEVTVCGVSLNPVKGKHGYTASIDRKADNIKSEDYDMLIIPGGKGPESIRLEEHAVNITKQFMQSNKPVASICHGIQVLISAEVLKGKKATCWKGVRDDLKAAGAEYEDKEVVVDGNLITSRHPGDLPAFMKEVLKKI